MADNNTAARPPPDHPDPSGVSANTIPPVVTGTSVKDAEMTSNETVIDKARVNTPNKVTFNDANNTDQWTTAENESQTRYQHHQYQWRDR